jgi:hypothetical protein
MGPSTATYRSRAGHCIVDPLDTLDAGKRGREFSHGHPVRKHERRGNLREWHDDERALGEARMRHLDAGFVDPDIAMEQQIEI